MTTIAIQQPKEIDWFAWVVASILSICLVFMTFVAVHNSQPSECTDIVYDAQTDSTVCEINLKG